MKPEKFIPIPQWILQIFNYALDCFTYSQMVPMIVSIFLLYIFIVLTSIPLLFHSKTILFESLLLFAIKHLHVQEGSISLSSSEIVAYILQAWTVLSIIVSIIGIIFKKYSFMNLHFKKLFFFVCSLVIFGYILLSFLMKIQMKTTSISDYITLSAYCFITLLLSLYGLSFSYGIRRFKNFISLGYTH